MRWKAAKRGDVRIRNKFLWFPVSINGEVRWLERATWEEEFVFTIWIKERWL
jgi:hypothetical protein